MANDLPKRTLSLRIPRMIAMRETASIKRALVGGVLVLAAGLTALTVFLAQTPSAPPPKPVIMLAQARKPAEPAGKLTDIVLPASTLSPEASAVQDPDVNIVANKIGDLPALTGQNPVQVADGNNDTHELLMRAHGLLVAQNYAAAIDLYNQVLAGDERNHDALSGTAFALAASGSDEEAVESYRVLLKFYPHDDAAEANLAHILLASGRNEDAIGALDKAAAAAPDNLVYRLELAESYDRGGHHDEALMLYRQIAEASEQEDTVELPIASIRQRIDYLEGLEERVSEEGASNDPSITRPVDN